MQMPGPDPDLLEEELLEEWSWTSAFLTIPFLPLSVTLCSSECLNHIFGDLEQDSMASSCPC